MTIFAADGSTFSWQIAGSSVGGFDARFRVDQRGYGDTDARHLLSRETAVSWLRAEAAIRGLTAAESPDAPMKRVESDLSRVMIRCPVTGRGVPTGLTADPRTWPARPIGLNRMPCPDCKQVHAWSKSDAFLEGAPGASSGEN
jgi:hypothetical protein